LTVLHEFKRRAVGQRLSAAFLQTVESSNRKAGIAENYRGSRSDPKDFGNKIQPNR
jgi:hypothetical protein